MRRKFTRREIAAQDGRTIIKEAVEAILAPFLDPEPGKMLPRCYVAKRRGNGRNGEGTGRWELCMVPRSALTVSERLGHVRRLRKTRRLAKQPMAFSEADALEAETLDLISSGRLMLEERAS